MEKIKINLASGSSIEKPLVSAFKSNNAIYVVFDNEINGTMGLPIILVSKLENNKLVKIVDNNEWNSVKEILRMIIAGNQVDYVVIDPALPADDVFFMQLTLPMASFDALKNNYRPNANNAGAVASDASVAPVMPDVNAQSVAAPSQMDVPVAPNVDVSNQGNPVPPVEAPVNPSVAPTTVAPEMPNPVPTEVVNNEMPTPPVAPVMPSAPVDAQTVAPVTPVNETPIAPVEPVQSPQPAPSVEPIAETVTETPATPVDFTADKEAFLKSCENMFDALVAKFRN